MRTQRCYVEHLISTEPRATGRILARRALGLNLLLPSTHSVAFTGASTSIYMCIDVSIYHIFSYLTDTQDDARDAWGRLTGHTGALPATSR